MRKVVLKRLGDSIIVIVGVTIVAFLLLRIGGGDPAQIVAGSLATEEEVAAVRIRMGLDKSYIVQYFTYVKGLLQGNFGYSYHYNMDVADILLTRVPQTLKLGAFGLVISIVFSTLFGVLAAVQQGKLIDTLTMVFVIIGQSMADVWLALTLVLVFAVHLKWFPTQGLGGLRYMILPAFCMAQGCTAQTTRLMRSGMVDVLREDYITAARSRGITKVTSTLKYALKNALLPIVTTFGSEIGRLLAGAIVIENVFNWPGMGELIIQAINFRDYELVQSILLITSLLLVIGNLLSDIMLTVIDPRISFN